MQKKYTYLNFIMEWHHLEKKKVFLIIFVSCHLIIPTFMVKKLNHMFFSRMSPQDFIFCRFWKPPKRHISQLLTFSPRIFDFWTPWTNWSGAGVLDNDERSQIPGLVSKSSSLLLINYINDDLTCKNSEQISILQSAWLWKKVGPGSSPSPFCLNNQPKRRSIEDDAAMFLKARAQ